MASPLSLDLTEIPGEDRSLMTEIPGEDRSLIVDKAFRRDTHWLYAHGKERCDDVLFLKFNPRHEDKVWFYVFKRVDMNLHGKTGWLCYVKKQSKTGTDDDFLHDIETYKDNTVGHNATMHHATLIERPARCEKQVLHHPERLVAAPWFSTYRSIDKTTRYKDVFDLDFADNALATLSTSVNVPRRDWSHHYMEDKELFFVRTGTPSAKDNTRFYVFQKMQQHRTQYTWLCQHSAQDKGMEGRTIKKFMNNYLTEKSTSLRANVYHIELDLIYADEETAAADDSDHTDSLTPRLYTNLHR